MLVVTLNIQLSFLLRWIFVSSNDLMKLFSRKNKQVILYNLIPEINNHQINRILSKVTDEILIKSDWFDYGYFQNSNEKNYKDLLRYPRPIIDHPTEMLVARELYRI